MESVVSAQQFLNFLSLFTKIFCKSDFGRNWQE